MTAQAKKLFLFFGILAGVITACLGIETQHSNHLGWALLLTGTAFTMIGCIYLGGSIIQTGRKQPLHDRSLWLPCLGIMIISLVTPLEYIFLPPVLPRSDQAQDIGLILVAGGLIFYLVSLRSAEPWQSPGRRAASRRIRSFSMILRLVLCPISASLLLFVFGLGVGYSSWIGLLVIFILVLPGLIHRIYIIDRDVHPVRYISKGF